MEDILSRLLVADNAVIQQATADLKAALKHESSIGDLLSVIVTSRNPQVRQYAAVVLRQRMKKSRNWNRMDDVLKDRLTNDILGALQVEQEKFVVKAIAQLVACIAKHNLPSNYWRQLLEFLGKLCSLSATEAAAHKERGFFILSVLSEECPDIFTSVLPNIGAAVTDTLQNVSDAKCPVMTYSLSTMKNLAEHFSEDQSIKSCYTIIMPQFLKLLRTWSEVDSDVSCNMLEMLYELVENSIVNTMNQINPVVNMCLQLAICSDEKIQFNALCVIDTVIKMKKRAIIKSDLLVPILRTIIEVMQMPCDEDIDYDNANELNSPVTYSAQVLDGIALNLPPGKIMPYILESIHGLTTTQDPNPNKKKAAYLIMAVTSEGCSEYICHKCFNIYFEILCKGLENTQAIIRNAALYALGQFSEHLQPEMNKHSEHLMPILFKFLDNIMANLQTEDESHMNRVFYALETLIEHSEKETFLPYLCPLIQNLLALVAAESKSHLKQLALSAIGACATTAEDNISPFLRQIVDCLSWLMGSLPQELLSLQIQAIETMATLARAASPENFEQVARDCIQYGYTMLENQSDPEMEATIYGLFGAASTVLKEDMSDKMGPVIENMLKTLESSEGIVLHYDEDLPDCGDLSDSADEVDLEDQELNDEDDEDVTGFSVENIYLDKKAAACYAIKDLALNTGVAFNPYLPTCSNAVLKLLEYPNELIKKAALEALCQLCVNCISTSDSDSALEGLSVFIQKCAEIIHTDEDKEVVFQALESYAYLLKSCKNVALQRSEYKETIFNCLLDVFNKRTLCQLEEEDEKVNNEDEEDAEQDELLIEYAGDVLPYFGKAMPPDEFKGYFFTIYPCVKSKLKPSCTVAQRSFGIGILAECMDPLGPVLKEFANEILPEYVLGVKSGHCDIRNNAVYGLGEMLYHGRNYFFIHYDEVLQLLSACLAEETAPKVIDNICAAVARMIITNTSLVPISQVFPVIMTHVPLKKDYKENVMIMKCFLHLYEGGHVVIKQYLIKILHTVIHIIHYKQGEEESLKLAERMFTMIQRDFPEEITGLRITDDLLPTYTKFLSK